MNATETLKEERVMQDKSSRNKALMSIADLAVHNVAVGRCLVEWHLKHCSFEDALIGMVLALAEQNKRVVKELVKRPVVYRDISIPVSFDETYQRMSERWNSIEQWRLKAIARHPDLDDMPLE